MFSILKVSQIRSSLLSLLVLAIALAFTSCNTDSKITPVSAQWISVKDTSVNQPNTWICFRKSVSLKKKPDTLMTQIATDTKYWLWINGELIIFEGALKRGPNPNDTYCDEIDLAPYLQKGENTLCLLSWFMGKDGYSHKNSGKAGLYFDAQNEYIQITSDSTWKVKIHPGYYTAKGTQPNRRLSESNVGFDARLQIDWTNPDFDDNQWKTALELGAAPTAPWNKLVKRNIPMFKDYGLKNYSKSETTDSGTVVAYLPYNAQVTPYLKVKAPAGKVIDIRTDNYKGGSAYNVRAEYITSEGEQEYESYGWMNGHAIWYNIPEGVDVIELKYRETGYNTEFAGTFECSDPDLVTFWNKAARTLYVTMRDNYMDCPDRERAQWMGDAVNEMGEAFYALDTNSVLLYRKALLELVNWQREDSVIFSPMPAGSWTKELPMQMLATVGWYSTYYFYCYSGDQKLFEEIYPAIARYMAIWKTDEHGQVIPRNGDWLWGDWGHNKDMDLLVTEWYYIALKGQLEMAKYLQIENDITLVEEKINALEASFNKLFWTGSEYRSPNYKNKTDDRVNAMAVIAGLAKKEYYPAILKVLQTQEHCSPYMEKYVMEALFMMGYDKEGLARMKKRFKPMIDDKITTLYEGWGIGKDGFGGGTINHAWSGGPLTIFCQYMVGLSPLEPGYAKYQLLPQPAGVEHLKLHTQTFNGDFDTEIKTSENNLKISVSTSKEITGIIGVPVYEKTPASISFNQEIVWKNSEPVDQNTGVALLETNDLHMIFSVPAGEWKVDVVYE